MKGLTEVALLGTLRHGGELPPTHTPVDALLAGVEVESRERRLLLAAGAESLYRQAGLAPRTDVVPPSPAATETLPACAPRAAALLSEVLREQPQLLPETLVQLARAGQRLPPALLPLALEVKRPALREALLPALGARGLWLAGLHPAWAWVLAAAPDDAAARARAWEEGSPAERLAALERERAERPEVARGWLAAVWKREKAEQRATFLEALAVGLGPDDEAFLETALEDRSQGVRLAASGLLCRLPGSALARRMRERLDALLTFTPPAAEAGGLWGAVKARLGGAAPSGVLTVEPPAALPREWERDGLQPRPPPGLGERAWWLAQLLSRVPPSHLQARLGATPAQVVRAAVSSEWAVALARGLSLATEAFADSAWAAPLWDFWLGQREAPGGLAGAGSGETFLALLSLMPRGEAEERVLQLLEARASLPLSLEEAVRALPSPWSEAAAGRYLEELARRLAGTAGADWSWPTTLLPASLALPPACLPRALATVGGADAEKLPSGWGRALDTFTSTLRLRQRLLEEIVP